MPLSCQAFVSLGGYFAYVVTQRPAGKFARPAPASLDLRFGNTCPLCSLSLEEVFYVFEDDFGIQKSEALRAEKEQQRKRHDEQVESMRRAHDEV
jgi:hypothetical protein